MPYLAITTNADLAPEAQSALAAAASKSISAELGKPEAYVMVSVQIVGTLSFGGSSEPAAFLDLKSIGLPKSLSAVSSALTALVGKHTGIEPGRVFIVSNDVPPSRWAYEGATFA